MTDLVIYENVDQLDHDVDQLLTTVLGDLRARGVDHEIVVHAVRRVAKGLS